jgi:hypothetical protein
MKGTHHHSGGVHRTSREPAHSQTTVFTNGTHGAPDISQVAAGQGMPSGAPAPGPGNQAAPGEVALPPGMPGGPPLPQGS